MAPTFISDADKNVFSSVVALKSKNPTLKVMVSIGGWNFNNPGSGTETMFSQIAASSSLQGEFNSGAVKLLGQIQADGIDIDWEYPGDTTRGGSSADTKGLSTWMSSLAQTLGSQHALSMTLPGATQRLASFDLQSLSNSVSWFNIMSYDYAGTWDCSTNLGIQPHASLASMKETITTLKQSVSDFSKLVLGIPAYGRTYSLSSPSCNTLGCGCSGAGRAVGQNCAADAALIGQGNIEQSRAAVNATSYIVYNGNSNLLNYAALEDVSDMIGFARLECLGGVMIWSLDGDSGHKLAQAWNEKGGGSGNGVLSTANEHTTFYRHILVLVLAWYFIFTFNAA
ncbi:hypothetical protein SmJEL517_g02059 [Synchytrium microbalum]|uniref:GH18 domain-containing protein n=1 Tax=Synchytrium microbalum TaxID=1806994 RepID=A0A507CD29_9FUNG|nr:uncharacterized protein SmJEL517_g02059 [Synchytrium microbalum]TPX35465.1 hypothetical protein SmJEL517_g02059 [Synchytrium microbalum]